MIKVQPSKMSEIKIPGVFLETAADMGRKAAKIDTWMTPCPEEHIEELTRQDDLGEISDAHRDGWQQTTHFEITYGNPISDLADMVEELVSGEVGGLSHIELGRYEGIYIPLRDAFWDAWEEESKFYELANEAIENARKELKAIKDANKK